MFQVDKNETVEIIDDLGEHIVIPYCSVYCCHLNMGNETKSIVLHALALLF